MRILRRDRRFSWHAVPGTPRAEADAADALRWLGRRLAYEEWLEELRTPDRPRRAAA